MMGHDTWRNIELRRSDLAQFDGRYLIGLWVVTRILSRLYAGINKRTGGLYFLSPGGSGTRLAVLSQYN